MTRPPAGCDALVALYPILAALPGAARLRLGERAQFMRLPAGTTVFDESQACQGFPFVLTGSIRVFKAAPSGRELPLYRVAPGETCVISSACLLGQTPYNARGVTESETTLLVLPNADFQALLAEPAFRDFIFQLFSSRKWLSASSISASRPCSWARASACIPPTSSWPTNWAAFERSSAACSRALRHKGWWPCRGSRWKSSTPPACAGSQPAEQAAV